MQNRSNKAITFCGTIPFLSVLNIYSNVQNQYTYYSFLKLAILDKQNMLWNMFTGMYHRIFVNNGHGIENRLVMIVFILLILQHVTDGDNVIAKDNNNYLDTMKKY